MPTHDSVQRTRRTGYSFASHGAASSSGSSSGSFGKHVLKRIPGVDLWSPSWGTETIIRMFPTKSRDNPSEFEPYRYSNSYCDFGDWIRTYDAVRNFGNPGVTMLLHNGLSNSYDAQIMNPCWVLYRAINNALSQGQGLGDWVPLTKGAQGKGAPLSKPSKLYLVQAAIFRHKDQDTFGAGRPPLGANPDGGPTIVMALPATAGENLIRLLEEKDEDWQGDPDSYDQFKYGDPVGVDAGQFVHIYELGKDPRSRYNSGRQQVSASSIYSASPSAAGSSSGNRGMDPKGYGVFLTSTLDGGPNDLSASLEGYESMVRSKVRNWDDILEFKTDEEQAHLVAPLFPASAILYAWRDHRSWIPDSVQEAGEYEARRPVSSSAPAAQSWGSAPSNRPATTQAGRGNASWGGPKTVPIKSEETYPDPQDLIESDIDSSGAVLESAESDQMLQQDESDRVAASKAKFEAASARAAKRKNS
jgi:hypothetical protein